MEYLPKINRINSDTTLVYSYNTKDGKEVIASIQVDNDTDDEVVEKIAQIVAEKHATLNYVDMIVHSRLLTKRQDMSQ